MIPEFSITIQEDIVKAVKYAWNNNNYRNTIPRTEIILPVIRILSVAGMISGVSMAFKAVMLTPSSFLYPFAFGVAMYAFFHDVFVMATNAANLTKNMDHNLLNAWETIKNIFLEDQEHPVTEDTLLPVFWNELIK